MPAPSASTQNGLLQVSAYDRVASTLIALLSIIGFFVMILVLLWLTTRVYARKADVPLTLLEELSGSGDHTLGSADDLDPPGPEELSDLSEPQLPDTLASVTQAISDVEGSLDAFEGNANRASGGGGEGSSSVGTAEDDGVDSIPRGERWEILYAQTTMQSYAEQLDFFGIELGVVDRAGAVRYAARLSGAKPVARDGKSEDEDRLYMSWRGGTMADFDKTLLSKADVPAAGGIVLQFYPPETENTLAVLEQGKLGGRPIREVRRTVFGVRSKGAGHEYFVVKVDFRLAF